MPLSELHDGGISRVSLIVDICVIGDHVQRCRSFLAFFCSIFSYFYYLNEHRDEF